MSDFYVIYGKEFTEEVLSAFSKYIKTQKTTSAGQICKISKVLFKLFTDIFNDLSSLRYNMKPNNANRTFEIIIANAIALEQIKGNSVKHFLKSKWKAIVALYKNTFIEYEIFETPLFEIILPSYKSITPYTNGISSGGGLSKQSKERLLSKIPISIKDDDAIDKIKERISRDIEHIKLIAEKRILELSQRHYRNKILISKGRVKPFPYRSYGGFEIGVNSLSSTLATFDKYRWGFNAEESPHNFYPHQALKGIRAPCFVI